MKKISIIKYFLIFLLALLISTPHALASEKNIVNMHLFYSKTCPHCANEIKMINTLEKQYSNLKVYKHEISNGDELNLLKQVDKSTKYVVKNNIIGRDNTSIIKRKDGKYERFA